MRQHSEAEEMNIRMWLEYINNVMGGVTLRDRRNKWKREKYASA